jgi:hypothetical protein
MFFYLMFQFLNIIICVAVISIQGKNANKADNYDDPGINKQGPDALFRNTEFRNFHNY